MGAKGLLTFDAALAEEDERSRDADDLDPEALLLVDPFAFVAAFFAFTAFLTARLRCFGGGLGETSRLGRGKRFLFGRLGSLRAAKGSSSEAGLAMREGGQIVVNSGVELGYLRYVKVYLGRVGEGRAR